MKRHIIFFTLICTAFRAYPQTAEEWFNLGYETENLNRKIEYYTKALEIDPQYAWAYNNRGFAKYNLKQYEAAILDYTKALEIDPKNTLALNNLEKARKLVGTGTKLTSREPKVWVLAVGINNYQYPFKLSDLDYSEKHAYDFARHLERYGFTDSREIPVLTSNRGQKSTILNFLNNEFCNDQVKEDDLVIFFFSGHGLTVDGKIGICAQDYIDANQMITDQEILGILKKSPARHKICFIESCKTEAMSMAPLSQGDLQKFHAQRNNIGSGIVYITSTEPGKESIQAPPEGGYFSYFLLEALKGEADSDGDNIIKSKELFDYVKEKVAEKTNNYQIPQINLDGYELNLPILVIN